MTPFEHLTKVLTMQKVREEQAKAKNTPAQRLLCFATAHEELRTFVREQNHAFAQTRFAQEQRAIMEHEHNALHGLDQPTVPEEHVFSADEEHAFFGHPHPVISRPSSPAANGNNVGFLPPAYQNWNTQESLSKSHHDRREVLVDGDHAKAAYVTARTARRYGL